MPQVPKCANLYEKLIHSTVNGADYVSAYIKNPLRDTTQYRPLSAEIIAPIMCDHKCIYCSAGFARKVANAKHKSVPTLGLASYDHLSTVIKYIDAMSEVGVKGTIWTGGGDWSLYKWFPDVLLHAKDLDMQNMWISHHASRVFCDNDVRKIVNSCSSIRTSLDAHNENLYRKIRRPTNTHAFINAVTNIRSFLRVRNESGAKTRVGLQMVVCRENLDYVADMVAFAKQLGVDYIQIRPIELRGALSTKDGIVLDNDLQTYEGIYLKEAIDELTPLVQSLSQELGIEILFRDDKFALLYHENGESNVGRSTMTCAGARFQMVLAFDAKFRASLRHCYFRHDLEISLNHPDELEKVLYGNIRSAMFENADSNPLLCSNGCKYADLNKKIESLKSVTIDEALEIIECDKVQNVQLVDQYII